MHHTPDKSKLLRKITPRLNALEIRENKCYARETTFSQKGRGEIGRRGGGGGENVHPLGIYTCNL